MRGLLAVLLVVVVAACAGRKVEVGTGATPASGVSLNVNNTLSQAVNVYVTSGGTDILVGQVPANTTRALAVNGVAAGSSVSLKAVAVDGTRTYTRDDVVLSGSYAWTLP
jgi:hypothetical protein